jgi:hypothetical protein
MRQADLVDEEIEKDEKDKEARKIKNMEASMYSEEEDMLEGEESEGNLSHEDADDEGDDYYEVIDRKGNCIRMLKGGGDDDDDDEAMEARIQDDKRFDQQGQRRRYSMGMTINRAVRIYRNRCGLFLAHANIAEQAANAGADSKVLDFSDSVPEKSAGTKIDMEPCSEGRFVAIRSKTGKFQYQELQEAEITELGSLASDIKCSCRVCTRRRQNVGDRWTVYGRTESRSGLKRGFYKYGEGIVLGDGKE